MQQIYSYYELTDQPELEYEPVYHEIAGTSSLWPIIILKDGKRQAISALWGLMPWYAKTRKDADAYRFKMVNARAETVTESNTFKYAMEKYRCIVPSSGFYEHYHEPGSKRKIPFFIKQKDCDIVSFAGIYGNWVDKESGEVITSYSIITRPANDLMAKIHNGGENPHRMPLMIEKEMIDRWLDPATPMEEVKQILDYKIPSVSLSAHPVFHVRGKNVLSGKDIIKEYEYEGFVNPLLLPPQ